MKIARRLPIFVSAGLLTFALGVWMTPVEQESILVLRHNPWQVLLTYENQDLLKLDPQSKLMVQKAVKASTAKRYEKTSREFVPALFRSMLNTKGEKRYALIELSWLAIIPSTTSLRVHVFDTTGRLLNVQQFNVGYRTTINSIRIRETELTENQLLVVEAQYCLGGHPSAQYYALADDDIALIYLEQDGKPDQNNYHDSHMTIGPQVERTIVEWENALGSTDDTEVLAALVWFNGNLASRSRDRAYRRLEELSHSENHFIKTAAESVLENK